jgi:hypothetical protein
MYDFKNGEMYHVVISQIAREESISKSDIINMDMINTFNVLN